MPRHTLRGSNGKFVSASARPNGGGDSSVGKGLESLEPKLRRRTDMLKDNVDDLVRQTALAIVQAVTVATPVDTGRARANWVTSMNAPAGDGNLPPSNDPIAQSEAVISGYTGTGEIHISNSVPYIDRLNKGWSKQAPANFVQLAVTEAALRVQMARVTGS